MKSRKNIGDITAQRGGLAYPCLCSKRSSGYGECSWHGSASWRGCAPTVLRALNLVFPSVYIVLPGAIFLLCLSLAELL